MSDYLLRMIDRAAGRASGETPRPPKSFRWAVPWGGNALDVGVAADEFRASGRAIAFGPVSHPRTGGPAESVSLPASKGVPELSAEFENPVSPRALQESLEHETNQPLTSAAVVAVSGRSLTPSPPIQPITRNNGFDLPELPASDTEIEELASPRESESSLTFNHRPVLVAEPVSPRPDFHKAAKDVAYATSPRLTDTADSVVEVNIGRVEVRLDVPAPPAPKPASRPNGFAEYETLRRYSAGAWPTRRR